MKPDLDSRKNIASMVDSFYEKVKDDGQIGYFFNEVAKIDWDKHLPKMYDFWESVILGSPSYSGNPVQTHRHLHGLSALSEADFDHWLRLFNENLDAHFEGKYTEMARQRALSIATVMKIKILHTTS